MKHLFKVAAVLFTIAPIIGLPPALAQPTTPTQPKSDGPRIKFSETDFDFGKLSSSDVVRHDFLVTNTGDAPLEISDVKPACGCTMAGTWDRQIQPGETGKIPIQFSPVNFNGPVTKSITVISNDPGRPTHSLQIRATIWRPIIVQPPHVYFTPIEGEETEDTKVVRITSTLDQPLSLEVPQASNPALKLELKTVQPGKEFELHVTYPGSVSNRTPQSSITIKTSATDFPIINLIYTVVAQPPLALIPPQITLPPGQLGDGYPHSQIILNNSSVPMKLTEATVNAEGVAVEITERQPGKMFILNVSFPPNFQARPGQPLDLTVHTSNPKRPVITVPIEQAVASLPQVVRPPVPSPDQTK